MTLALPALPVHVAPWADLLAIATAEIGVVEVGGPNRGPGVEQYIRAAHGLPGQPWCAAFVSWCAIQMQRTYGHAWPLAPTMGCQSLADQAKAKGLRYLAPVPGAIFLLWFPTLHRFAHTGFVERVAPDGRCTTVEGNTNPAGGREGYGVFRRTRTFTPTARFIRWWLPVAA